jgi:CDGSH-type Zn-finger protein
VGADARCSGGCRPLGGRRIRATQSRSNSDSTPRRKRSRRAVDVRWTPGAQPCRVREEKELKSRNFAKPSNGLEPSTPSLPSPEPLRWVATGCGAACLSHFGAVPFATGCHWLRPLGSINAPYRRAQSLMGTAFPARRRAQFRAEPFVCREGSSALRPSCDGSSRRCTSSSNPSQVERGSSRLVVTTGDDSSRR